MRLRFVLVNSFIERKDDNTFAASGSSSNQGAVRNVSCFLRIKRDFFIEAFRPLSDRMSLFGQSLAKPCPGI